jgi:hypothetical protein
MNQNASNITGDGNVVVQGVTARDIIINIAGDLPVAIRQQKQELNSKIKVLVEQLAVIESDLKQSSKILTNIPAANDESLNSSQWKSLMQALRRQKCVLFLGPEISVDESGESLHTSFFKGLAEQYDNVDYLEDEGLFSLESEYDVLYDAWDYYKDEFPLMNKAGRALIEQLAQLPFSLIVSLCPDDTIHQVYKHFNLEHDFVYYKVERQEVDAIEAQKPLIYNILGNLSDEGQGRYILSHENFYNFLYNTESRISIPYEIKKKIQDATHYIFFGFDFDKWYNHLLLFILGFEQKMSGLQRLNIGKKNVKENVAQFISRQFKISFMDNDHSQFTSWLLHNAAEEGILRNLKQHFVQQQFSELQKLNFQLEKQNDPEEISKLDKLTDDYSLRIQAFKNQLPAT